MSVLQWSVLIVFAMPILFYIGVVVVLTHVRARVTHRRIHEVPLGYHPRLALGATLVLATIVWIIIPLCGTVYKWALAEDEPVRVTEVAPLDRGRWWYATFERPVACEGELRLASSAAWSYPSPDCNGAPTRQVRFPFEEQVQDGAYIQLIQVYPGGSIGGTGGEEVDLDFEPLRFAAS